MSVNVSCSLVYANTNGDQITFRKTKNNITVAGEDSIVRTQVISESAEEALDFGEIGTAGWAFFENIDDTNFVEIRPATGETAFLKLLPGEAVVVRLGGSVAPYAIADTAAVRLRYGVVEV